MPTISFIQVLIPLKLDWEPLYSLPEGVSVQIGDRVKVNFSNKDYTAVVTKIGVDPQGNGIKPELIKCITSLESGLPRISEKELSFWEQISAYYLCSRGEVYKAAYPVDKTDHEAIQARENSRLLKRVETLKLKAQNARNDTTRARYMEELGRLESMLSGEAIPARKEYQILLSPPQKKAFDSIMTSLGKGKTALLEGVTGSGKTEVYLKLASEYISKGKQVLFLVPEIALSRQLEDRVKAIVPDSLTYHSSKSSTIKRTVANELRNGNPCLVLGTRSALFLPFSNLGLVIVDEEHDSSYKQTSPAPRYHARESAIMLSLTHGAGVILGSATPSLESQYNAKVGIFEKTLLKEKYYNSSEPEILIIDTIAERKKRGMAGSISFKLISELQRVLDNGEQAILFRSRRSYAPAAQCTECGKTIKCPRCNIPMSLHMNPARLVCHYCGRTQAYTGTCPSCSGELALLGTGTQKIEEEIRELFPRARIARLDSDNAAEGKTIIKSFSKGETDILIGTQMISKGFDFPGLTLVAIVQADDVLARDNFRADEQAVQLFRQLRGRSGRRSAPGKFVIQTREPDHPVFKALEEDKSTCAPMLEERRNFSYPPYTRLVNVEFRDRNPRRLELLSGKLERALSRKGFSTLGPFSPGSGMNSGEHVRIIRISLARDRRLQALKRDLHECVAAFEKENSYPNHIAIDVDPL